MIKLDLHVHTRFSKDSVIPLWWIKRLSSRGYLFAITDHNTSRAWKKLEDMRVAFIPGEEISTLSGDVVGLYLTENINGRGKHAVEVMEEIHEQGGLAYLPHIFDENRRGVREKQAWEKADIIEGWNARAEREWNLRAQKLSEKLRKPWAVGTDSHTPWELGRSYLLLEDAPDGPEELLKLVRKAKQKVMRPAPLSIKLARAVKFKIKSLLRL